MNSALGSVAVAALGVAFVACGSDSGSDSSDSGGSPGVVVGATGGSAEAMAGQSTGGASVSDTVGSGGSGTGEQLGGSGGSSAGGVGTDGLGSGGIGIGGLGSGGRLGTGGMGTGGLGSGGRLGNGGTTTGGASAGGASSGGPDTGGPDTGGATTGGVGGAATAGSSSGSTGGSETAGGGGDLPPVYGEEFTGEDCPLPTLADDPFTLPEISHLPNPFEKADGTLMTTRAEWRCRRAEIKAILEKYDAGAKPGKPSTFEASLSGNTLSITVGEGSSSFTMTAAISRPAGAPSGPIPAIIGINGPTGSLPADVFSSRGIATITFNSDQIMANGFSSTPWSQGNFYQLYPSTTAGSMVRWAWGISRIIDALEELPESNIDTTRLAVSGCSYQGKIALFAGAFDERIALTIPHESGGGGTISWRYSDMLEDRDNTEVENLHHAQGAPWYAQLLKRYEPTNVSPDTLPYDHHELVGMIAPRAVLAIESSQVARMGAEAARIDALAVREIYTALGVPTRMGATEENTAHCTWHQGFTPALEAYVERFLLGNEDVDTDILRSTFTNVDRNTWIPWETPTLE